MHDLKRKIICIGLNYRDHAAETGAALPKDPILFSKYPTALIGHGEAIVLPPVSKEVDYEAELVIVIGKACGKKYPGGVGGDYVAGYTVGHDAFPRAIGNSKRTASSGLVGKTFDTFRSRAGPDLVTADEVPDPQNLAIRLRLNGQTMQDSSTKQLIFGVADLLAYISQVFTLEPGDLIYTGTPPGVGIARKPPVYLKGGDVVEVEIEGLGVLPGIRWCRGDEAPAGFEYSPRGLGLFFFFLFLLPHIFQFFRPRQILEATQAEDLQESFGRAVEDGAAQGVVSAGDAYQTFFHEQAKCLATMNAADAFDVGAHDRLAIGHDGERLAGGPGQAQFALAAAQGGEPAMIFRPGQKLETAGQFFYLKGRAIAVIEALQFANQTASGGGVGQAGDMSQPPGGYRFIRGQQDGFQIGQLRLASQGIVGRRIAAALARPAQGQGQGMVDRQTVRGPTRQGTQKAWGLSEH